jgi:UDPglucose 6-dehydrogenase
MSVCVIGQGFVGGSLTTVLSEAGEIVYTYDKVGKRAKGSAEWWPNNLADVVFYLEKDKLAGFSEGFSGVYFICVPTPMYEDGAADLSIVEEVLDELSSYDGTRIAVVKSTVPPGTTEFWNKKYQNSGLTVIFNPEFLTEANALNDMREQNRIVLGGPRPQINTVKNIFQRAFPNVPIIKTSSTTAEMIKYVTNCMLAVKVSFANEIAQICESLDADGKNIDYDKVIEYAKFDKRLGDTHWSVPGPVPTHDGRYVRGFGGHCFPKDINALMYLAKSYNINPTVMQAAWEKNLEVRPPQDRDWERQIGRAVSKRKE